MSESRAVRAHGLVVEVDDGWEARVFRRADTTDGARAYPVVHLATFPLPAERGDFGAGAVEVMGRDDVFVTLFEYERESVDTPLFKAEGWPEVLPEHFEGSRLQHSRPGQSGCQYFFQVDGRAWCLYVVVGSHSRRADLVPRAAAAVHAMNTAPASEATDEPATSEPETSEPATSEPATSETRGRDT